MDKKVCSEGDDTRKQWWSNNNNLRRHNLRYYLMLPSETECVLRETQSCRDLVEYSYAFNQCWFGVIVNWFWTSDRLGTICGVTNQYEWGFFSRKWVAIKTRSFTFYRGLVRFTRLLQYNFIGYASMYVMDHWLDKMMFVFAKYYANWQSCDGRKFGCVCNSINLLP